MASAKANDLQVIVAALRRNGFKTVPAGSGHRKVVDHRGRPVVDRNGPVILSSTPSETRNRTMAVNRLMKAGALKVDPFESDTKSKGAQEQGARGGGSTGKDKRQQNLQRGNPHLVAGEYKEKAAEATRQKAKERHAATMKQRERLEPIIVKLGGWGTRAPGKSKAVEISAVWHWFIESRGIVEKVAAGLPGYENAMRNYKAGNTVADASRASFEYFLRELEDAKDPLARYMEMLRLSRGLPPKDTAEIQLTGTAAPGVQLVVPERPKDETEDKAKDNGKGKVARIAPAAWTQPHLAVEAVAQMMVGRDAVDGDVLQLGQQILELELRERGLIHDSAVSAAAG